MSKRRAQWDDDDDDGGCDACASRVGGKGIFCADGPAVRLRHV